MFTIPEMFEALLEPFCQLFSVRVWRHAQVLLVGAILSPVQRTVAAAMRAMGLSEEKHFINYHRVLSRAVWSSRKASQILLVQLIGVFAANGNGTKLTKSAKVELLANSKFKPFSVDDGVLPLVAA